ncbi:MAG: single-stranded DNA-binding protein [Actinomycetes bacterium]
MTKKSPSRQKSANPVDPVNAVHLRGRLSAPPVARELPSGDVVVTLRVVVARPERRRRAPASGRAVTVDTIDCSVWAAALRRRVLGWGPGDEIAVEGSLRRRFWRGQGGAQSRYEVEVVKARREARG